LKSYRFDQKMLSSDLPQQLRRQLLFLRNSVSAFDAGDEEEAVRIGVVIRVLCHDTRNSTSLLREMGKKESLELVTTAKALPDDLPTPLHFCELMAGMTFGNSLTYDPVPPNSPTIPCHEWWSQVVFIRDDVRYTRRDVVLSAANKDGGAHVDAPDEKLLALQEGFWIVTKTYADGTKTRGPLSNNHFRMLRRFAGELLASNDLFKLAEQQIDTGDGLTLW